MSLDPQKPETWVNNKPAVDTALQSELTRVGGVVPTGAYAGQPKFKLVFGQTETEFLGGKQRMRFRDARIPRLVRVARYFCSAAVAARLADYAKDKPIINEFGVFDETRESLAKRMESEPSFEYMKLDTITLPEKEYRKQKHLPTIAAPSNWLFISEIEELISIGRECWYVMRWMAPEDYESRESWERNRFAYDVYIPDVGQEVAVVDFNGPYPENGVYVPFTEIAEYLGDDYRNYKYLKPSFSTAVQPVIDIVEEGKLTPEERALRQEADRVETAEDHMREIDRAEEEWEQFQKDTAPMFAGKERAWQTPHLIGGKEVIHKDVKSYD